jgi:hypothetical protein
MKRLIMLPESGGALGAGGQLLLLPDLLSRFLGGGPLGGGVGDVPESW